MGVDFTPGNGSAIFSIADGVVTESADDQWGFGNHVVITHHINGHTVTTLYAHMQHGSTALAVGDTVLVGDFIGLVGQTGTATGAHLHLEITVDGAHVDPFAWLKANAN
jgi:murein DD-endopeptidase MepM/ murein hydrolase activator NlpD